MTDLASELASLRALAKRLSEPWPAERRLQRAGLNYSGDAAESIAARMFPHAEDSRAGYWQHRRSRAGKEWRGPEWREPRAGERAAYQRARLSAHPDLNDGATGRSWMPSIARVGSIVLRWPAQMVRPEIEEWRTYEAIRRTCSWAPTGSPLWFVGPGVRHGEAREAVDAAVPCAVPRGTDAGLDAFARAIADRLARRPINRPATSRRLDRATLGALAARYCRAPYNRHDARRWMRRFRAAALVASDLLETGDVYADTRTIEDLEEGRERAPVVVQSARVRAIEVLCEAVGLEDAIGLTERPRRVEDDAQRPAPAPRCASCGRWHHGSCEVERRRQRYEDAFRGFGRAMTRADALVTGVMPRDQRP